MRARASIAAMLMAAWTIASRPPIDAQVRPVYDLGAAGIVHLLGRLQTTASALHVGAHPDDEDSAFLARVARGDHARAAYLSLNRGEGGQNIIGPELFEALGVIRTEELLQARRLDGSEQYFTRTFDFGFSKSRAEAAARWNEREVLGDIVRVIRMFRPFVVYARFTGTPADGHGQHQLAGYLTPLALEAAADPTRFPEQVKEGLTPWRVRKLYRRRDPAAPPSVELATGALDPVIGRSFAEIAAEGRSQHKSQEQGTIEPLGPAALGLRLVESRVATAGPEQSLFDGIDVRVSGLADEAGLPPGSLQSELRALDAAASEASRTYAARRPSAIVPALLSGLRAARSARAALARVDAPPSAKADADFLLAIKENDFTEALLRAAGIVVDPLADSETVPQGSMFGVTVRTFLSDPALAQVLGATVTAPPGWQVVPAPEGGTDETAPFGRRETPHATARFRIGVPADAPVTQPYYLVLPRDGDRYRWRDDDPLARPFGPAPLRATVSLRVMETPLSVTRPVEYRFADAVRGELRRNVAVVPAVAIGLDAPLLIVPADGAGAAQRLVVRATSFSNRPVEGTLRLRMPPGWSAQPNEAPFLLSAKGDKTSAQFRVTPPARRTPGAYDIAAEATGDGRTFTRDLRVVAYPHIQTHRIYSPARATARVIDLEVADVRVGYVMGSGDQVPDALRRMGVDVTMIDDDMLATADLSVFDTIVVGVRASEAREEFTANHGRLIEYAERGGVLVVQYQQTDYVARGLPPYPARSPSNSRVTDETARVRILRPDHPLFTFPNRITEADFDGWVQERNLYAFGTYDPRYEPLLESADPGESPQTGGQLYARVGKGHYVYTAYSWFRQLPAGVPGAYRQFANLISLAKAPR